MKSYFKTLPLLAVGLCLLSACQALPINSLANLEALTDLDPADVKVALWGPSMLQVRKDDFKLSVKFEHPDLPQPIERSYVLEKEPETPLPRNLSSGLQPGERAEVYGFSPATVQALRQLKQDIARYRQPGKPGKGTLATGLSGGCKTGPLPEGPLYVGAYVQIHHDQGFSEAFPKLDLRPLLTSHGLSPEAIPDCQS